MHGFWRGVIGASAGSIALFAALGITRAPVAVIYGGLSWGDALLMVSINSLLAFPLMLVPVGVYAWLTRRFNPNADAETRCRKCRYILRGISEPRCPECGERI